MDAVDTDEEYLDDPITLIDSEQYRFGCYASQTKDYAHSIDQNSSVDKRDINLPGAITTRSTYSKLSEECRPLSIQLVDCAKFPWYYKVSQKLISFETSAEHTNENQEESDENSSELYFDDIICLNPMCEKVMAQSSGTDLQTDNELNNFNEKQLSCCKSIVRQRDRSNDSLCVDFKKNRGLIGMRIIRSVSFSDAIIQTDNVLRNNAINAYNTTNFQSSKFSKKLLQNSNTILKDKIATMQSNSKVKESTFVNKEKTLNHHELDKNSIINNEQRNSSPILKINVSQSDYDCIPPVRNTANCKEQDHMEKSLVKDNHKKLGKRGKKIPKDTMNVIKNTINEKKEISVDKANRQNNKLVQNKEARCKSPVFPCKIKIKERLIKKLSQKLITNGCKDTSYNKCLKDKVKCRGNNCYNEGISQPEDKQTQTEDRKDATPVLQSQLFEGHVKRTILPTPFKLNNIVQNLYKNKLQQKIENGDTKIKCPDEIAPRTKNNYNLNNLNQVKDSNLNEHTYIHVINRKEKNFKCNDVKKTESTSNPSVCTTLPIPNEYNCNFNNSSMRSKTDAPLNFNWASQQSFLPPFTSRTTVRHRIPHSHLRIRPVSEVLLSSIREKQNSTFTPRLMQTDLPPKENNNNIRTEHANNLTISPRLTTKAVNEHNSNKSLLNKLKGSKEKNNNQDLIHKNQRKGYSPPILPIPTYQATLQYLANIISKGELNPDAQTAIYNVSQVDIANGAMLAPLNNASSTTNDFQRCKEPLRKRKLATMDNRSNKITLHEYEMRSNEIGHVLYDQKSENKLCKPLRVPDTNLTSYAWNNVEKILNSSLESQDLGYDSDRTMIL